MSTKSNLCHLTQLNFNTYRIYKGRSNNIKLHITPLLKKLENRGILSQSYETIRPTGSWTPRLYGLPKIHKPGWPMSPILDLTNSQYHSTARCLTQLLEPVRWTMLTRSIIEQLNVRGKSMFSFDVTSLFTRVLRLRPLDTFVISLLKKA